MRSPQSPNSIQIVSGSKMGDGNLAARGDKWKIGQDRTVKVNSSRGLETKEPRADYFGLKLFWYL